MCKKQKSLEKSPEHRSVLLTGATGFLGRLLLDEFIKQADRYRIFLLIRDKNRAETVLAQELSSGADIQLIETNVENLKPVGLLDELKDQLDYIIHCAAITDSACMVSNPVEVADGIVLGTRNMLELARLCHVRRMLYLSSMEVYGVTEDVGHLRHEEELGQVALESVRSCYPMGKRMAEHYCHIYHQEYGVPVRIARLAQTFGKGIRWEDNRVFAQFARAAVEGRDIVLKTAGKSIGNYCAAEDAVCGILMLLERGEDGQVYNIVNEANTMSIRQMAHLVAEDITGGTIRVIVEGADAAATPYAPDTGLRMSADRLTALGWQPTKGLKEMYMDIIKDLSAQVSVSPQS